MGYYTDKHTNPSPRKSGGWIVPILIGIIAGALIMFVIYPNIGGNKDTVQNDTGDNQEEAPDPKMVLSLMRW